LGRPKLGVKLTTVRLSEAVMARIDALCGKNRRGEFIREAVEAELDRRERAKP
jgi:predicted transcriptional regulator